MPRKPVDLPAKIVEILDHVGDMPPEAEAPFSHYILSSNASVSMRRYVMRKLIDAGHYPAVRDRHFATLNNMVLVNLIQSFERFIKDLAAVCVDHLFDRMIDGRFDEPQVRGSSLAAHFAGSSPGKALCESGTWLDCKGINERFKDYLRRNRSQSGITGIRQPRPLVDSLARGRGSLGHREPPRNRMSGSPAHSAPAGGRWLPPSASAPRTGSPPRDRFPR